MDKILRVSKLEYVINILKDSSLIGKTPKEIEKAYDVDIKEIIDEDGNFLSLKGAKTLPLREGYKIRVCGSGQKEVDTFIKDLNIKK